VPFESMDEFEFERELRQSLERQPAPLSLKRKVMDRRQQRRGQLQFRRSATQHRTRMIWLERIAASLVVAGVAGSAVVGHYAVEHRKGEEAKQQVFTALRITNHAFRVMNAQLQRQNKDSQ